MLKQKVNKKYIIIFATSLLVVAGLFVYLKPFDTSSQQESTQSPDATSTLNESQDNIGSAPVQQTNIDDESAETTPEPATKSDNPSTTVIPENLNIVDQGNIVIDQLGQDAGLVSISASITSDTDGECFYNFFTNDEQPVIKSSSPTLQQDEYICSIEINEVEFTRLGTWQAEVIFTTDNESYKATEEFNVQ